MPNGNHEPSAKKIIFLDIDGPLLPARAWVLPGNRVSRHTPVFDPIAVSFVLRLIERSKGAIVVSSTWRARGEQYIRDCFNANGLHEKFLHDDWATPTGPTLNYHRKEQIAMWLQEHAEVTHYVCIDDIDLESDNCVLVSFEDGMLLKHYRAATVLLDCEDKFVVLG